jgi:hypothetical protein
MATEVANVSDLVREPRLTRRKSRQRAYDDQWHAGRQYDVKVRRTLDTDESSDPNLAANLLT